MKKKIQKVYHDPGFGFPVTLLNVPMVEFRGEWVPAINQKALNGIVIQLLVLKPARLTGNEVRFLRLNAEMNLQQFADRFDVTHPAVLKWERTKDRSTGMSWSTEKDLRLFALRSLTTDPKQFVSAYESLIEVAPMKNFVLKIDVEKLAA